MKIKTRHGRIETYGGQHAVLVLLAENECIYNIVCLDITAKQARKFASELIRKAEKLEEQA